MLVTKHHPPSRYKVSGPLHTMKTDSETLCGQFVSMRSWQWMTPWTYDEERDADKRKCGTCERVKSSLEVKA